MEADCAATAHTLSTMNKIESVEITGFWGTHNIALEFDPEVNFLIGRNGSGKTTVINLIAACLSADFPNIDRVPFDRISIKLKEVGGRRKPSVTITKYKQDPAPFPAIRYEVREFASAKAVEYSLDDFEEQLLYREYRLHPVRELRHRWGTSILDHLSKLVQVSWLSIHRFSGRPFRDERNLESAVDRKLEELSNALVRFFSQLSDRSNKLMVDFQKSVFLSLLSGETEDQFLSQVMKFDLAAERRSLEDIYVQFGVEKRQHSGRTQRHFQVVEDALRKVRAAESMSLTDFAAITATTRIHDVIEKWTAIQTDTRRIYEPRENFLNILNSLVYRKRFGINDKNELSVEGENGVRFPLTQLSSGEKQLLIVLGEALLQEQRPYIYIADEPGPSLHVRWQETLVKNLKAINPNAQIVFATHSPDIVSVYRNSVIDMERVLE